MVNDPHDVVRLAAGDLVMIEVYQANLKEAGIESRVDGDTLASSFGSAIPGSIEIWVHRSDVEKATALINALEMKRKTPG